MPGQLSHCSFFFSSFCFNHPSLSCCGSNPVVTYPISINWVLDEEMNFILRLQSFCAGTIHKLSIAAENLCACFSCVQGAKQVRGMGMREGALGVQWLFCWSSPRSLAPKMQMKLSARVFLMWVQEKINPSKMGWLPVPCCRKGFWARNVGFKESLCCTSPSNMKGRSMCHRLL